MEVSRSLYVSNFPEDWVAKDVKETLEKYWPVIDVFLPQKRNATGKRFAFARFEKNANLSEILVELKGLWIGDYKIIAHRARFDINDRMSDEKHTRQRSLKDGLDAEDAIEFLMSKNYFSVQVSPHSDDRWVIHMNSKDDRYRLLQEDKLWLALTFNSIGPWKESEVSGRRRVWLDVHGVPIHAWSPQFFKKTGNKFGKIVKMIE